MQCSSVQPGPDRRRSLAAPTGDPVVHNSDVAIAQRSVRQPMRWGASAVVRRIRLAGAAFSVRQPMRWNASAVVRRIRSAGAAFSVRQPMRCSASAVVTQDSPGGGGVQRATTNAVERVSCRTQDQPASVRGATGSAAAPRRPPRRRPGPRPLPAWPSPRLTASPGRTGRRSRPRPGSSESASSTRSTLIRLPIRSSIHMRAPPAPQQNPRSLQRCISSVRSPGTEASTSRGGV